MGIVRPSDQATGDLASLLGMSVETDNIVGKLAEQRTIKEAVVAVPFMRVNDTRQLFHLPKNEVYQAVRDLGFENYKKTTEQELADFAEIAEFVEQSGQDPMDRYGFPRLQVRNMVSSMLKYNIPPQFNFLKYNDPDGKFIQPFVMYLFEYSFDLSQQDLANIWSNTTPDIGLDFYGAPNVNKIIESKHITHRLFHPNDVLSDPNTQDAQGFVQANPEMPNFGQNIVGASITGFESGFKEKLHWMLFKVKQKAESSYFRKKELDRLPDGHPDKNRSVEDDIYRYGFNWPYDYFSIVELVNLKATFTFDRHRDTAQKRVVSPLTADLLEYRRDNK